MPNLKTIAISVAMALAVPVSTMAQQQVVRLVTGFPAGGPSDAVARPLAERLSKQLGKTVIVENKPGANGNIAASFVAKAPADGSVLFFSTSGAMVISPALYPNLPYDPVRDFAPVSLVVDNSSILVVKDSDPANTAREFVDNSLRARGPVAFSSTGVGSIPHMALELFKDATGANLLHIPYKGAAPAVTDVLGGHVAGLFADGPAVLPQLKARKLKAIGIAGPKRLPLLPSVPTLEELGIKGVVSNNWYAIYAPKATPVATVTALSTAITRSLATPELQNAVLDLGASPVGSTPAELEAVMKRDAAKWTKVIADKKIVAE